MIRESEVISQSASILLEQLLILANKQNLSADVSLDIFTKNIGMKMLFNPLKELSMYSLKNSTKIYLTENDQKITDYSVKIRLPLTFVQRIGPIAKIYCYSFSNSYLFIPSRNQTPVASEVFSLNVDNQTLTNLKEPIRLWFSHSRKAVKYTTCRYWQTAEGIEFCMSLKHFLSIFGRFNFCCIVLLVRRMNPLYDMTASYMFPKLFLIDNILPSRAKVMFATYTAKILELLTLSRCLVGKNEFLSSTPF